MQAISEVPPKDRECDVSGREFSCGFRFAHLMKDPVRKQLALLVLQHRHAVALQTSSVLSIFYVAQFTVVLCKSVTQRFFLTLSVQCDVNGCSFMGTNRAINIHKEEVGKSNLSV